MNSKSDTPENGLAAIDSALIRMSGDQGVDQGVDRAEEAGGEAKDLEQLRGLRQRLVELRG